VVAVGGNSLIGPGQVGTIDEQFDNARGAATALATLVADGWRLALVHGNGPQVGFILRRSEAAPDVAPRLSLDMCDADSQGGIGYMLQQSLGNALLSRGVVRPVVALITQVEVDPSDAAFQNPTKPIGRYYSREEAELLRKEQDWLIAEEGKSGWRRLVPSPMPRRILEIDVIKQLVSDNVVTICAGGGGIPVAAHDDGGFYGVEAVIDKDRVSALLAGQIKADVLLISTPVECVALDFGTPGQRPVRQMTADEAMRHHADGQFPPGSMGPKIEAAVDYLRAGGKRVIITDFPHILPALAGETGTRIDP
jgi:carbamate kinase